MKRSTGLILPTHTGSLPRPADLIDMMREKESHRAYYKGALTARASTRPFWTRCAGRARPASISRATVSSRKGGFGSYQSEWFAAFERAGPQPARTPGFMWRGREAFAQYYAQYFKRAMFGAALAPQVTYVCTGPVRYARQAAPSATSRT